MTDDNRKARRAARIQHRKAATDGHVAAAREERGLVLVNTGQGKGKSSAAFGVLARALGNGLRCAVIQFIKNRSDTGEAIFFRTNAQVRWHVMGDGFTWETRDDGSDRASAGAAWKQACRYLRDEGIALVILDEFTYTLAHRWLELDDVIAVLDDRPWMQHVIITGRDAPDGLIELADTVTDMVLVKHAYRAGVKAMPGIEW